MQKLVLKRAAVCDIPLIQSMADVVFRVTYASIISESQMEFMLDWMYSEDSLRSQIVPEDKAFFIAFSGDVAVGYVSLEKQEESLYHLQKLYLLPDYQGCGLGRQLFELALDYVRGVCPGATVELNVNRTNKAVGFYEAMGMSRVREGDFPIGNGFYMNDYIYAIKV